MNFIPTRPVAVIGREYVQAIWDLFEPAAYLERCMRHCLDMTPNPHLRWKAYLPVTNMLRLAVRLFWNQGFRMRGIRRQFWRQLWTILTTRRKLVVLYLGFCAAGDHFWEYRGIARRRIAEQLGYDPLEGTVAASRR
jgi:hypothetical protein